MEVTSLISASNRYYSVECLRYWNDRFFHLQFDISLRKYYYYRNTTTINCQE